MPSPIEQLLQALSGTSPNEDFAVGAPDPNSHETGLGLPYRETQMRKVLNMMQNEGVAPPLPEQTGSGPGTLMALMQMIQAIQERPDAGFRESPNPDPGFAAPSNEQPGAAALGSDANRELLKALIGG